MTAFFYCYLAMLLGIVTIAAAEHAALEHPFDELTWWLAALLSGGVAIYLGGDAVFRLALGIGAAAIRGSAALLALAMTPVGATVSAAGQIGALVALLGVAIVVEHRRTVRSPAAI